MGALRNWKNWVGFLVMLIVVRAVEARVPQVQAITRLGS